MTIHSVVAVLITVVAVSVAMCIAVRGRLRRCRDGITVVAVLIISVVAVLSPLLRCALLSERGSVCTLILPIITWGVDWQGKTHYRVVIVSSSSSLLPCRSHRLIVFTLFGCGVSIGLW